MSEALPPLARRFKRYVACGIARRITIYAVGLIIIGGMLLIVKKSPPSLRGTADKGRYYVYTFQWEQQRKSAFPTRKTKNNYQF